MTALVFVYSKERYRGSALWLPVGSRMVPVGVFVRQPAFSASRESCPEGYISRLQSGLVWLWLNQIGFKISQSRSVSQLVVWMRKFVELVGSWLNCRFSCMHCIFFNMIFHKFMKYEQISWLECWKAAREQLFFLTYFQADLNWAHQSENFSQEF